MTLLNHWLLTILVLIPATGGVSVLLVRSATAVRRTAIAIAVAVFCASLLVLILFQHKPGPYDYAPAGVVQMACSVEILPAIHCNYRVAMDGLSLPFVVVTSLIGALGCAATPHDRKHARWFFAMLLWLETAALGVFISFDLLLLWMFLALSLIPCCGLLALDDQGHRGKSILILLIPMLIALACLFVGTLGERLVSTHCLAGGTLDLVRLASLRCDEPSLFLLMLISFLILLPVFPLHSWVTTFVQSSSTVVVAMIVGLVRLIGGYGLLRVVIPLFPSVAVSMWWLPAGLGLAMVLYCALCAIGAGDNRLAAVHVTLCMSAFGLIGVATQTAVGVNGAVIIFLSQSLIAPFLFGLTAAVMRSAERSEPQGGVIACLALAWLAELVLPGLLAQIMVLLGVIQAAGSDPAASALPWSYAIAAFMCLAIVLVGVAAIRVFHRIPQAKESGRAGPQAALILTLGVAAVLLAMGVIPLCIGCASGELRAIMMGRH